MLHHTKQTVSYLAHHHKLQLLSLVLSVDLVYPSKYSCPLNIYCNSKLVRLLTIGRAIFQSVR